MGRGFESHGAYHLQLQPLRLAIFRLVYMWPISTKRLRIQPLQMADLAAFVRYRQDPGTARFQGWDENYSLEQGEQLIKSQLGVELPDVDQWLQLGIYGADQQLLGDLALHKIAQFEYEIGFTLAPEQRGQGIAKEAVQELVHLLRERLEVTRVIASTDARNEPSTRLLTAVGFSHRPEMGWEEEFKAEHVKVDFFELTF